MDAVAEQIRDKVLDGIREDIVLGYTRELVTRPSENPPGTYEEISAWVLEEFRRMGLQDVKTIEGEKGRINVLGKIAGKDPSAPRLCLASHTDTVKVGDPDKWTHGPFSAKIVDGVMWGRGIADSKGMLAGMMAATRAIIETGIQPQGDLYLCAYVDDETAGPMGLRHVFNEGYVKSENLILGEATHFEIQYVFKSRIWFDLETVGRSAHGAFPERGINSIDKAMQVIAAIRGIDLGSHPALGKGTINVGKIHAGEQVNVVPGTCKTSFDLRWGPPTSSDEVRRLVAKALDKAKAEDPELEIGEMRVTEVREPLEFPTDSPLVQAMKKAGRDVFGQEIGLGGWYSSGELWPVAAAGHIKYGAVIGPGEPWQAHAYDEQVPVRELVDAARVYALSAVNIVFPQGNGR